MSSLTDQDREFLRDLLSYSPRLHNGYYVFQPRSKRYGNTKYKRSRIIMQLYLNKWLKMHEIVHHKDRDKTNDSIDNLEVNDLSIHTSNHSAGKNKFGKFNPSNKLDKDMVKKIKILSKRIIKSNGSPNCYRIGKIVGVSGVTISRYV